MFGFSHNKLDIKGQNFVLYLLAALLCWILMLLLIFFCWIPLHYWHEVVRRRLLLSHITVTLEIKNTTPKPCAVA